MTPDHAALPPALLVRLGDEAHLLDPRSGVAVIGRDNSATVRLSDDRVSRWHVRLEPHREGWQAIDTSTNGMYLDGVRRSSVLISQPTTVHLANPEGFPVTLTPHVSSDAVTGVIDLPEPDEDQWWESDVDPGVARAGHAVAARRSELEITQRGLAKDKIINAGTLIAFEKGRSWPRRGTLSKLEKALQWSPGTIARIRSGSAVAPVTAPATAPSRISGAAPVVDASAEASTDSVRAPLMAEAVELAMHSIAEAASGLPEPSDPEFTPKVTKVLADLRKLENVAASAARNAKGTPSVVLALSTVRRTYNDVMAKAARSPNATLGQRLYGARHRAELSVEEAAAAAGLPPTLLADAEAERPIPDEVAAAITTLIGQLAVS